MRISNLPGYLWVSLTLFLSLSSNNLFSQENLIASNSIFHPFTEELPEYADANISYLPNESFRLQLGLFANQENAEKLIDKVASRFELPIYIFLEDRKHKQYYRILMGDFKSPDAARDFIAELKHNGLKGIVKKYNRWEDSI